MSRARLIGKTGCCLLIVAGMALSPGGLQAESPAKTERKSSAGDSRKTTNRDSARARLIESANGWMYVNGEWIHPEGYKFINNKVLRTTAKAGKTFPKPPSKLALENPTRLTPRTKAPGAQPIPEKPQTPAEKAAEARRKNLTPSPASQTGTHL